MASAILRFRIDGGALQSSSVSDTPANLAGKERDSRSGELRAG